MQCSELIGGVMKGRGTQRSRTTGNHKLVRWWRLVAAQLVWVMVLVVRVMVRLVR